MVIICKLLMIMLLIACFCVVFEYYVAYSTCQHCRKSFWVIGGSKLGFWMKRVREFVSFWTARMKLRLKRDIFRLSEIPRMLSRWSFAWREMQANSKRDFPRLTSFRSLEANHERTLSEREPIILWGFRLKRDDLRLKRDRSCKIIFWILLRALGH